MKQLQKCPVWCPAGAASQGDSRPAVVSPALATRDGELSRGRNSSHVAYLENGRRSPSGDLILRYRKVEQKLLSKIRTKWRRSSSRRRARPCVKRCANSPRVESDKPPPRCDGTAVRFFGRIVGHQPLNAFHRRRIRDAKKRGPPGSCLEHASLGAKLLVGVQVVVAGRIRKLLRGRRHRVAMPSVAAHRHVDAAELHHHVLALRQLGHVRLPLRENLARLPSYGPMPSGPPKWSRMMVVSGNARARNRSARESADEVLHASKVRLSFLSLRETLAEVFASHTGPWAASYANWRPSDHHGDHERMPRKRVGAAAMCACETSSTAPPKAKSAKLTTPAHTRVAPTPPLALIAAMPLTNSVSPTGRIASGPSLRYIEAHSTNTVARTL